MLKAVARLNRPTKVKAAVCSAGPNLPLSTRAIYQSPTRFLLPTISGALGDWPMIRNPTVCFTTRFWVLPLLTGMSEIFPQVTTTGPISANKLVNLLTKQPGIFLSGELGGYLLGRPILAKLPDDLLPEGKRWFIRAGGPAGVLVRFPAGLIGLVDS